MYWKSYDDFVICLILRYGPCPFNNNTIYLYKTTFSKETVIIYEQRRDTYEYFLVKEITKDEFDEFFEIIE